MYNLRCIRPRFFLTARLGAYVGLEQVFSTVVDILTQPNFARDAFRSAAPISQNTTSVQPNLLWASCLCEPRISGFALLFASCYLLVARNGDTHRGGGVGRGENKDKETKRQSALARMWGIHARTTPSQPPGPGWHRRARTSNHKKGFYARSVQPALP